MCRSHWVHLFTSGAMTMPRVASAWRSLFCTSEEVCFVLSKGVAVFTLAPVTGCPGPCRRFLPITTGAERYHASHILCFVACPSVLSRLGRILIFHVWFLINCVMVNTGWSGGPTQLVLTAVLYDGSAGKERWSLFLQAGSTVTRFILRSD